MHTVLTLHTFGKERLDGKEIWRQRFPFASNNIGSELSKSSAISGLTVRCYMFLIGVSCSCKVRHEVSSEQ